MSSFTHLTLLHGGGYRDPLWVIERQILAPRLNYLRLHDNFSDLGSNFDSY